MPSFVRAIHVHDPVRAGNYPCSYPAGFPKKENFVELARSIYDAGADLLEIGIPLSDPLADGPVIQNSSQIALANGINLHTVLRMVEAINKSAAKPLILMGYSNPIIHYGFERFAADAGVDGLIIPNVPLEENDDFFGQSNAGIDSILLTTPTSPKERIIFKRCSASGKRVEIFHPRSYIPLPF